MRNGILIGIALLGLISCGGAKVDEKKVEEAKPAATSAPVDPATLGTVTGKVNFDGAAPARKIISMDAVPQCARQHKDPVLAEDVIVNGNATLKNVFVRVKDGLGNTSYPVPMAAVELDQKGCIYTPHVLGIMVGQDLAISNNDPTNHNIHPMPEKNKEWNESQPPQGDKKIKQFSKEEVMVPFKCNVHPWMKAYVGVVSNPFYAVTGDDGTFRISGLPPGEYTLEAWHERYGRQEIKVKISPKATETANFSFKS